MTKLNYELLKECGKFGNVEEMAGHIVKHNNSCRFCVKGGDIPCGVGKVAGVCEKGVADWLSQCVPDDWPCDRHERGC